MRHPTEDDLTLLYYGELSARDERQVRAHLEGCAACRAAHEELLRVFAAVDGWPVPEPDAGFEGQVWRRLQPALRATAVRAPRGHGLVERLRGWLTPSGQRWALAGAAAVLVLAAFTAGRYFQADRPQVPVTTTAAGQAQDALRERILLSALGDHFDRTQGMLVELASASADESVDISGEQRRARDLLAATRLYRGAADQAGDRNVADVLEALERVLVEVTVSPSQLTAYELVSLQKRIENQELLFKLRVASTAVREREQANRPAAVRGNAGV